MGTGWQDEEFGAAHRGRAVAVLADGSEPGPVVYDTGSAAGHASSQWWVYDGTLRAPLATRPRGACACGWRGTALHPVDWAALGDRPYDVDPLGPYEDWFPHVRQVAARAVPVPDAVAGLLQRLDEQLACSRRRLPPPPCARSPHWNASPGAPAHRQPAGSATAVCPGRVSRSRSGSPSRTPGPGERVPVREVMPAHPIAARPTEAAQPTCPVRQDAAMRLRHAAAATALLFALAG